MTLVRYEKWLTEVGTLTAGKLLNNREVHVTTEETKLLVHINMEVITL